VQQQSKSFGRPLYKMGTVAFIFGIVVFFGSTMFHASREDPTDHAGVFAEYSESDTWIAAHIGQFAGGMLITAGFVALYRFFQDNTQSGTVSALSLIGLMTAIITAGVIAILQAVDGISLKMAVDSWAAAPAEEKMAAFRVAEGIRWIEIGINSIFRILQGATAIIFSTAILIKSGPIPRWVGGVGMFAGVMTIVAGVSVAYVGFAATMGGISLAVLSSYFAWIVIMGVYMWRRGGLP
jgi:hypothetical protein